MNTELGRKVLDHITGHRDQFDMAIWGERDPGCGTTACLAGWAMLLSGYQIRGRDQFVRPDGVDVHRGYLSEEASVLLGLSAAERYGSDEGSTLFGESSETEAIARFRALVEAAEAQAGEDKTS